MIRGYQRADGLVYNGVQEGHALWMDAAAFDKHLQEPFREACRVRNALHHALSYRHHQRIKQERRDAVERARASAEEKRGLERARRVAAVEALRVERLENKQVGRALRLREIGLL